MPLVDIDNDRIERKFERLEEKIERLQSKIRATNCFFFIIFLILIVATSAIDWYLFENRDAHDPFWDQFNNTKF